MRIIHQELQLRTEKGFGEDPTKMGNNTSATAILKYSNQNEGVEKFFTGTVPLESQEPFCC